MRVDPGDRVVVTTTAGQPDELDVWVAGEQPDQLGTDVAGGADDPDPDPARPAGRIDPAQRPRQDRRRAVDGREPGGGSGDRLGGGHERMTIHRHCIVMQERLRFRAGGAPRGRYRADLWQISD